MANEFDRELTHMIDPSTPELSSLETLRHSAAHIMADAVVSLWPDAKLAFGPHTEDGFYYDIDMEHRLSPEDLVSVGAIRLMVRPPAVELVRPLEQRVGHGRVNAKRRRGGKDFARYGYGEGTTEQDREHRVLFHDRELWQEMAEMGWLGAARPEEFGGAGRRQRGLGLEGFR